MSSSAFIPFCEFGGNKFSMGVKIEQFGVPVCKSFQAKVLNDQLCYEVDLNRFVEKDKVDKYLKLGFSFAMDYNEDRQVVMDKNMNKNMMNANGWSNSIVELNTDQTALVYLNTIGKVGK